MELFSARGHINRLPCIFAAALASRQAVCGLSACAQTDAAVSLLCTQPLARANCAQLKGLLRAKARFVLARRQLAAGAVDDYVQCAGLAALRQALDPAGADVQHLLRLAAQRFQRLDALPFAALIRTMSHWPEPARKA